MTGKEKKTTRQEKRVESGDFEQNATLQIISRDEHRAAVSSEEQLRVKREKRGKMTYTCRM